MSDYPSKRSRLEEGKNLKTDMIKMPPESSACITPAAFLLY